jgi:hypothetical protein
VIDQVFPVSLNWTNRQTYGNISPPASVGWLSTSRIDDKL